MDIHSIINKFKNSKRFANKVKIGFNKVKNIES